MIFSVKVSKNDPLRDLRLIVSGTRMHRLLEKMFLLVLRLDHFSNETIKFAGPTPPFFCFKKSDIFSQIQQKRPSKRPEVARFRDMYAPTSRKHVCTEPKTRPFQ